MPTTFLQISRSRLIRTSFISPSSHTPITCLVTNRLLRSSIIDLSEETLKALAMPSKRPAAILQHLERQAEAIKAMRDKIRDQLSRCQADELFMKRKLAAAPLSKETEPESAPTDVMKVDVPVIEEPVVQTPSKLKTKVVAPIAPPSDDEEDEDEEEEDLPPSMRAYRRRSAQSYDDDDYDDDDDDDDDYASREMRRILDSNR